MRIDADSDVTTANRNAIRVSLTNATKNKGWQINANTYCFGNHYEILNCSPSFADGRGSKGGIKHDGIDSWAQLFYTESVYQDQYLIEFNGDANVGMVGHIYNGFPYDKIYHDTASGNNWKWQFSKPNKPVFVGDRFGVNGPVEAASASLANVGASASLASDLTLPNGTTKITGLTADFDDGMFDDANDQFEIQRDGAYLLSGAIVYSQMDNSGYGQIKITVNGGEVAFAQATVAGPTQNVTASAARVVSLSTGDIIELTTQCTDVPAATADRTFLSVAQFG